MSKTLRRSFSLPLAGLLVAGMGASCTSQNHDSSLNNISEGTAAADAASGTAPRSPAGSAGPGAVGVGEGEVDLVVRNEAGGTSAGSAKSVNSAGPGSSGPVESKSPASTSPASAPFVAQLRRSVPSISMLSRGTLEVRNGCLVAVIGEEVSTLVLPPQAKIETKSGSMAALSYSGRRLPLGIPVQLSGGGADIRDSDLRQSIPQKCPKSLFVIGG